jgi:hypothetical protein
VRSFGTEDRPTERPIAPRDEVYEYIIFRGPDIKDIRVCQPPKPQPLLDGGLPNDPAILQVGRYPAKGATRVLTRPLFLALRRGRGRTLPRAGSLREFEPLRVRGGPERAQARTTLRPFG